MVEQYFSKDILKDFYKFNLLNNLKIFQSIKFKFKNENYFLI